MAAICHVCGAGKDLALARCAACGTVPTGAEREDAVLCSDAILDAGALKSVQERIRRGERLHPSPALRARARAVLSGVEITPAVLSPRAKLALALGNLLLTPLLGYAVWFRWRTRPGPGARQVLWVTIPVNVALVIGIVVWRGSFLDFGNGG